MAENDPKAASQKPTMVFPQRGGAPRPPLPRPGGMTPQEVIVLAKDAARAEIVATTKAIASTVQQTMARAMGPLNEKFALLMSEQYQTAITMNALIEVLEEKGLVTKAELEARVTKMHEAEMAKRTAAAQKKGGTVLAEATAKVEIPASGVQEVAEAPAAAAPEEAAPSTPPVEEKSGPEATGP